MFGYATALAAEVVKAPIQVFGIEGRYAHALFSAASKKKSLEKVEQELNNFQQLVTEKKELADFMRNPTLNKLQKQSALTGILKDLKYSELAVNLFSTLAANSRLTRTPGVIRAYTTIMSAHRGEVPCTVTTAEPLDAKSRTQLEGVLKTFLEGKQVLKLFTKTDPSIIGGMVVEIGDQYIDMTTSTKIKKILQTLTVSL